MIAGANAGMIGDWVRELDVAFLASVADMPSGRVVSAGQGRRYIALVFYRNNGGNACGVAVTVTLAEQFLNRAIPMDNEPRWRGDWGAYVAGVDPKLPYGEAARYIAEYGAKLTGSEAVHFCTLAELPYRE